MTGYNDASEYLASRPRLWPSMVRDRRSCLVGCFTKACGTRSQTNDRRIIAALGGSQALDQSQVFDYEGESLRGRSRTSLLLLAMPIVEALGKTSKA